MPGRPGGADKAAIAALYERDFQRYLRVATGVLGHETEAYDAVQDAFAAAIARRDSFRAQSDLEGWVWRIVINAARDRLRQKRSLPVAQPAPAAESRESDAQGDEVLRLVQALPERQKLAVFLRYYADLSYDRIALVLGVSIGTVGALLHQAHAALRLHYEEVRL